MLPFVARNQWLEKRNQELLNEKPDSDQKRIAAEKKLAAITLEMKETLIAFESRTMALKKCEEEQEKWRMQKAQELEGTELEAVQELWLSTQEERVKAEVKKQTEIEVRKTVEPHIRAECAKAQEEGCKAGYVAGVYDGVKKGHLEGQVYAATIWRERVTSAEKASRNNSYTAGRVQGYADGRREGYNVGISDGFTIDWQSLREKEPENVARQISRVMRGAGMKDVLRATTRVTLKAPLKVLMQLNRKKAVSPEITGSAWLSLDHNSFGE